MALSNKLSAIYRSGLRAFLALVLMVALPGCVLVQTSLTEEERQKIKQPDEKMATLVVNALDSSEEYVRRYDLDDTAQGRVLSQCMTKKAQAIGVENPGRIKVVVQDDIPRPGSNTKALALFKKLGIDKKDVGALTLGHTIYIKPKYSDSYNILLHEFVHVAQMEKMGVREFIKQYAIQLLSLDYHKVPLEAEAFTRAAIMTDNLTACDKLYRENITTQAGKG